MNRFTPYAAVLLRIAVGLVFLHHGVQKMHMGAGGVAGFFHSAGIPFATIFAYIVMAMETVGAVLLILGVIPRIIALAYVIEMLVAIFVVILPNHQQLPELEALLCAASLCLVASGGGPLSLQGLMKKS
ncbi:MAG TPA: DoxX family protein [Gemmatimonadales bacterium]|nr:DoxX family protein [Gemmatimonadales bacterium]